MADVLDCRGAELRYLEARAEFAESNTGNAEFFRYYLRGSLPNHGE